MKRYPSIPRRIKGRQRSRRVHVFDKLDGSNLRFEWSRENGWHRFGSRNRVLDESHEVFGGAMALFTGSLAEPIERVARDHGWTALVAFTEFWGPGSLAGQHDPATAKQLTLFDVAPYRHGFIGPLRFLELFDGCQMPSYLGEHTWDDALIEAVRRGELAGVTFEGVVGKAGDRHQRVAVKAKTQAWVDAVIARYGAEEGARLVNS